MAVVVTNITLDDTPTLIATGNGSGKVLIVTDEDIEVGGTSGSTDFPLIANDTATEPTCLPLGLGEELWAVTTTTADVFVYQNGS